MNPPAPTIALASKVSKTNSTLLLPTFASEPLDKIKNYIDEKTYELLKSDYNNRRDEIKLVYGQGRRLVLFGLGEKTEFTPAAWRRMVQAAVLTAKTTNSEVLELIVPSFLKPELLESTAFAAVFACYDFQAYKQNAKPGSIKKIIIVTKPGKQVRLAIAQGQLLATACNTARDLANHPANVATPSHLAAHARLLGKQFGFKVRILNRDQIKKERLGLLLGVSAGSEEPPKFIILEYGPSKQQPIVLVGKGLTFDSGGVSIKPSEKLEEMKYDMCGGATVLGIFEAAARLKLNIRLVGLIPSAENLLSGRAVKPGDVLTSHSGKTVEIINTDAEGRLVLADAISFAKKYYNPKLILDFATLTGAVLVALGNDYTGYFTNQQALHKPLKKASDLSGEKLWPLPLAEEYKDHLQSSIADLKNLGDKEARVIAAALFLQEFVGETPWIHFDIAGTAWSTRSKIFQPTGATGWGVYLGVNFLRELNFATKA